MKHKLLQTWARKSAKLLAAFALLATTAGTALAQTATLEILNTDVKTGNTSASYVETEFEFTAKNNKFKTNNINPDKFQVRGNKALDKDFYLFNTTEFGIIKEIKLTATGANLVPSKINLFISDKAYTAAPTGEATVTGGADNTSKTNSATLTVPTNISGKFFYLQFTNGATSGNCYLSKIEITYEAAGPITSVATPTFSVENNATVYPDTEIIATCSTSKSTVYINDIAGVAEAGTATYTVPANAEIGSSITLTAYAKAQGESAELTSETTTIAVTVVEAPKTDIFTLVTDLAQLNDGSEIIITGSTQTDTFGMGNTITGEGNTRFARGTETLSPENNKISGVFDSVGIFKVTKSDSGYTFCLVNGGDNAGKYISGSAKNNCAFSETAQEYALTLTDGVLKFVVGNNALFYNKSSQWFNFDSNTTTSDAFIRVNLYVKEVAPVAPELPTPTVEDGVEVNVVDGGWRIRPEQYPVTLTFAVEDGVQMYAKQVTAAQAAAEDDNDGYVALADNKLTLTKSGEEYSVYAMKDGVKSEAKTITADVPSGIAGIEAENGEAVYFNLQGVRVQNPEKGIFIRVQNGSATKIMK